jgi:hypothetical protein
MAPAKSAPLAEVVVAAAAGAPSRPPAAGNTESGMLDLTFHAVR